MEKVESGTATGKCERLRFAPDGSIDEAPLRAVFALAESLLNGQGVVQDGRLVVSASNPLVQRKTL